MSERQDPRPAFSRSKFIPKTRDAPQKTWCSTGTSEAVTPEVASSSLVDPAIYSCRFRCLWAQRIDPAGAPVGNPIIVRHFHSTKGISTSFGDAITADGFLYEAAEESANVWKLTPARQP
jgi:hypothetical protein